MKSQLKSAVALLGDIAIFYGSLWLALLIRYQSRLDADLFARHIGPFTIVLGLWIITFYVAGLYDNKISKQNLPAVQLQTQTLAIAGLLAAAFFYVANVAYVDIRPLTILAMHIVAFGILFVGWRFLITKFFASEGLARNILFVGGGGAVKELIATMNKNSNLGVKTVGIIDENGDKYEQVNNFPHHADYGQICADHLVDTVVITPTVLQNENMVNKLYACISHQIRFMDLPSFYEEVAGKIPIDTIGQSWFLEKISLHRRRVYDLFKRITDIILSIIFGVFALILLPFIALAIKLDSTGPVFYKQQRVGQFGTPFTLVKFRTMTTDAEANGPVWSKQGDNRVTRTGSFLRKTRLDELPQLWNIFKADLSFVGPRPERPEFVQELTQKIPFYNERHLVKPGLTGWAQISLAYDASEAYTREKLQYDLFYIKNRGLLLELAIILKTIKSVLVRSGR